MAAHFPSMARAVYDFSLYEEVATQRARRTAGYFSLFILCSSLIIATATTLQLRAFIQREVVPELHKLPVITIKDHQASCNCEQPWKKSIVDDNTGMETVVIIDTTGKITRLEETQQGFLLTKTQLIMRDPRNPMVQPVDLSAVDDMVIDATTVQSWIPKVLWGTFAVLSVALVLYFAAMKLLHALLASLVGLIVNTTRRRSLRFGSIFAISIYALTPAVLLDVLRSCANIEIPYFWFMYIALASVFAAISIKKIPDLPPDGANLYPPGFPPQ